MNNPIQFLFFIVFIVFVVMCFLIDYISRRTESYLKKNKPIQKNDYTKTKIKKGPRYLKVSSNILLLLEFLTKNNYSNVPNIKTEIESLNSLYFENKTLAKKVKGKKAKKQFNKVNRNLLKELNSVFSKLNKYKSLKDKNRSSELMEDILTDLKDLKNN